MNAVPASNYAAFQTLAQYTWPVAIGLSGSATIANGWSVVWSADAGATWGSGPGFSAIRLEYAGSLFEGIPIQNIAIETTNMVYAAREVGDVFTTPANAIWNVRGACMWMTTKAGTPTGNARVRLYDGVTLLATTVSTWPAGAAANGWYCGYFSANQVVAGGSTLRVVLSETTQSDTSSNAYRTHQYTIENNADSKALMPFGGTLQMTYTTDSTASPVVFTETATKIVPFALLLNTDGEFAATSGGGVLGRVVSQ
jgi:hypothetical protein